MKTIKIYISVIFITIQVLCKALLDFFRLYRQTEKEMLEIEEIKPDKEKEVDVKLITIDVSKIIRPKEPYHN